MNVAELIQALENTIKDSQQRENGGASIRICRMYNEVIFYLIEKGELSMGDDQKGFYKFVAQYSPPELYKVAEYHRKAKGKQPLNYQQDYYY